MQLYFNIVFVAFFSSKIYINTWSITILSGSFNFWVFFCHFDSKYSLVGVFNRFHNFGTLKFWNSFYLVNITCNFMISILKSSYSYLTNNNSEQNLAAELIPISFLGLFPIFVLNLAQSDIVDTLEESNKHKFQNSSAFSVRQTYNIMQVVFSIGMANSNIVSKEYVPWLKYYYYTVWN